MLTSLSFAQRKATVIKITDGDTFTVVTDIGADTLKIRPSFLNTPEGKNNICSEQQEFYSESKEMAQDILLGKSVILYLSKTMSFNRHVARVQCVDKKYGYFDVWMIKNGYAWSFIQNNPKHYQYKLQLAAQKKKIGLWNPLLYPEGEVPQNPSEWLRTHSTRK